MGSPEHKDRQSGETAVSWVRPSDCQAKSVDSDDGGSDSDGAPDLYAVRSDMGLVAKVHYELTAEEIELRDLIETDFDADYYILTNDDVKVASVEPIVHFLRWGRHEDQRRPALWFDPQYYKSHYPDWQEGGLDAFTHYLRHGRAEGRTTRRTRGAEFRILDANRPAANAIEPQAPFTIAQVKPAVLTKTLHGALKKSAGLTVAVSHDRFTENVGGVQILLSAEQEAVNAKGETYIHLAPVIPLLRLAPDGSGPNHLHVSIDGTYLGVAAGDDLLASIEECERHLPDQRRLAIHCLLGHQIAFLTLLHASLGRVDAVFWVHDYESICVGYNLLRNNITYCGAPPPDSLACSVCIHGDDRKRHLVGIGTLFARIPFHVVAPSQAALDIWLEKAELPHLSAQVHETVSIEAMSTRCRQQSTSARGTARNPIRLAFVGHPAAHKGWESFKDIAAGLETATAFEIFHLSSGQDCGLPGVAHIAAKVSWTDPGAMTKAVAAASIDLVLILSPWPETFCIVASEVLAAGADILTLDQSGNVAALVHKTGRGKVFATPDTMLEFLTSLHAIQYVRVQDTTEVDMGETRFTGVTASVRLPAPALAIAWSEKAA